MDQDGVTLLIKAFFLNPVLPMLLLVGGVLGVLIAYVRKRPIVTTVTVVETVAIIVYACTFLLFIAPVIGIGAVVLAFATLGCLWRTKLIQPHAFTILTASVVSAVLLLAA